MIYHIHKTEMFSPLSFGSLHMYQLGRAYCEPSALIKNHLHKDFYELTVIKDGEGTISASDVPTRVKKGDIYISFPYELHSLVSDTKHPMKYDHFAFSTDDPGLNKELLYIRECHASPGDRVFHDERLCSQLENAIAEISGDSLYANELLGHILNQIPIYLVRALSGKKQVSTADPHTHADVLCYRMMNHIDTHLFVMKELAELADVFGYSYKYLSTLYRRTTGQTLSEYYRQKKLDLAVRCILDDDLKISEIAGNLGYSSVYSFSKAFKERFGMAPREYKAKEKKEQERKEKEK